MQCKNLPKLSSHNSRQPRRSPATARTWAACHAGALAKAGDSFAKWSSPKLGLVFSVKSVRLKKRGLQNYENIRHDEVGDGGAADTVGRGDQCVRGVTK